jgi:serine/threonine protein kinase
MILNEINILREIDHKNIPKLQRVYENEQKIFFVLDLVLGETLLDLIWR